MTADPHDPTAGADDRADGVAQLIRVAGRRVEPPVEAYEQTLAAAMATWDQVQSRRRRRWLATLAAAVVLAIGVAFLVTNLSPRTPPSAGYTDRIVGTVEVRSDAGQEWSTLREELQSLPFGTGMRTSAGSRAGVVLAAGRVAAAGGSD